MQLILLTALTMIAFAANSVLARLALAEGAIDPASYSAVRLAAGAIVLVLMVRLQREDGREALRANSNWASAAALFVYVAGFSYAYLVLETGIGALILFACVQATMIGWGLAQGERPGGLEWAGLAVAAAGFVWLVSPGLSAPDPFGTLLMVAAGIGWGIYSLRGRGATDPLAATGGNFDRAVRLGIILLLIAWLLPAVPTTATSYGLVLAIISGAITSGLGYALWYRCLPLLTSARAAIVQLTVPAIATLGGAVFAGEALSLRLVACCALILGGVALAITAKQKAG